MLTQYSFVKGVQDEVEGTLESEPIKDMQLRTSKLGAAKHALPNTPTLSRVRARSCYNDGHDEQFQQCLLLRRLCFPTVPEGEGGSCFVS